MKLSEIKKILAKAEGVNFKLENGKSVPEHFHVTEVGILQKTLSIAVELYAMKK